MLKTCAGSSHCGALRFEADLGLQQPTCRCNGSICPSHALSARGGYLW